MFRHFLPCLKDVRIVLTFVNINYGCRRPKNTDNIINIFIFCVARQFLYNSEHYFGTVRNVIRGWLNSSFIRVKKVSHKNDV